MGRKKKETLVTKEINLSILNFYLAINLQQQILGSGKKWSNLITTKRKYIRFNNIRQISIVTGLFWKTNCAENSNTDMTIMLALKHLPPAFSSIRSVKNKQNEHLFLVFWLKINSRSQLETKLNRYYFHIDLLSYPALIFFHITTLTACTTL